MPDRPPMAAGMAPSPPITDQGPAYLASRLLRRARSTAAGAFVAEGVLVLLFLWAVNPSSISAAAGVLVQSDVLIAPIAVAMLLPLLTIVWVGWLLQSARGGNWVSARRLLPAVMVLGYFSLIVPGYFLNETLHLIDSPRWIPSATPAH